MRFKFSTYKIKNNNFFFLILFVALFLFIKFN